MQDIPREIAKPLRAISHQTRMAVINELQKEGKLSFSQLQQRLKADKALLTFHLKVLTASGMVEHFYLHELGNEKYSFYGLTGIGKRFLSVLQLTLEVGSSRSELYHPRQYILELHAASDNYVTDTSNIGKPEEQEAKGHWDSIDHVRLGVASEK